MSADEWGSGIFPQHRELLIASGISAELARERGYVSADTKKGLEQRGFGPAQRQVPALVIPLWDVAGQQFIFQVRPDHPRAVGGRVAKYETPTGQKMVLDCHPRVRPHLGDPSRTLIITEGVRKADAAVTAGIDAVDVLGVWNFRGTNDDGGKRLLAGFEFIALNGRQVLIAYDSDVSLNPKVHEAMSRLAEVFSGFGGPTSPSLSPQRRRRRQGRAG